MQRPLVYYSNTSAGLRVLIGARDIELNPGPLHMSTHEIPVLVTALRAVCKELTPSRTIKNLIPISVQNRSLIATNFYLLCL